MKVLIIGAGIGGLALAHRLRSSGVEVEVFERNAAATDSLAGYGIHLNVDGWGALRQCLPEPLFRLLDRHAGHAGTLLNFHTEALKLLCVRDDAAIFRAPPERVERRSIGRLQLRKLLLRGLEPTNGNDGLVRFGKHFVRYEHEGRKVIAHFADGSYATGDALVGADASHSRIRKQYLPHIARIELNITNIAGRLPLHAEIRNTLPSGLIDGSLNNIVPPDADWMFLSAWLATEGSAQFSADPETRDCLVWAYAARAESYAANVETCGGERLREMVLSRMWHWSATLRAIVENSDPASIKPVPLRSMPVLPVWKATNVTLIGDAIHNMTPMAGIGANTALLDAAELGERLAQAHSDPLSIQSAIAAYEERMREYANKAVALSKRNAERATTKRGRLAFRTVLRVAERFPAVKRRLFAGSGKASQRRSQRDVTGVPRSS